MSDIGLSGQAVGRVVFLPGDSRREFISESPAVQFCGWFLVDQETLIVSVRESKDNEQEEFF